MKWLTLSSTWPGIASVNLPFSTTATPFTNTYVMPSA